MYSELYEAWKRELENVELEKLPPDFYVRIADYVRMIREESRMLEKRTAKAGLLRKEMQNAKHMIIELIQSRHQKIIRKLVKGEEIPHDVLALEEEKIYAGISYSTEMIQIFAKEILRGHVAQAPVEKLQKRTALRFLRDTPAIVGADMKTYGPFKAEDVASLPFENAKILVKQALAEKVEVD